jgi:hypothetical protein
MVRSAGIFFVSLWLVAITVPALASTCSVRKFRTLDNQTANGNMYAVSGKPCGVTVVSSRGPVHGTRLVTPPGNGHVSIKGNRVIYVSRPGYVGDDRFVYARDGMDAINRPITRTVEMSVKVADHL